MRIAFFTELPFTGKVPASHPNMRTEFAWMNVLNADHYSFAPGFTFDHLTEEDSYVLGIIIFPKDIKPSLLNTDLVSKVRKSCKHVTFMQEGPNWYFQDLPIDRSFWLYSQMQKCDFVLAHNVKDVNYYEGLLMKKAFVNPSLMVVPEEITAPQSRNNVMIGGNLTRWYGGFNSLAVVKAVLPETVEVWLPRMGRMFSDELYVSELHHLPYLLWKDWIVALNNFKYAVHLNPVVAGGTFSLNCAYLGIPCIGSEPIDTQRLCFPDLSVDPDDIQTARHLLRQLYTDQEFYNFCSTEAKRNYTQHFSTEAYLQHWTEIENYIKTLV